AFTTLRIPKGFNGRNPQARRDLASALRSRTHGLTPPPAAREPRRARRTVPDAEPEITRLRAQIRAHPCHRCPDREDHARWAERYLKLDRDTQGLRRRIEQRTHTISRQFDRVCEVLTTLGYLDRDTVTASGQRLMRLYTGMDLVAAEALRLGLWDDLSAGELAATLSALVFESRRPDEAGPGRRPGGRAHQALSDVVALWSDLDTLEREHKLDFLREPDLGFAWAAYRGAEGAGLDEVLDESDLAAGDFVRWVKQLLDLTDQVADAAGDTALRSTARRASKALRRGVVAYSSVTD
ncbi:MAG: DEAD/DEAH box helicase, partial [Nocardioidaceae bacterium]